MKTKNNSEKNASIEEKVSDPANWLNTIRRTFRSWYGYLPIEILTTDKVLIGEIEAIERLMMNSLEFKK